jgi:hypothetical protein
LLLLSSSSSSLSSSSCGPSFSCGGATSENFHIHWFAQKCFWWWPSIIL